MHKKSLRLLLAVLVAGVFAISCNEMFAPEVNFGNKTYINDYRELVDCRGH